MTKWIFTVCLLVIVTLLTGAASAFDINEGDDLPEQGFGGGTGIIDSIGKKAVVINDMEYKFGSNTKFLSNTGGDLIKSMFKEGDRVNFILNFNSEIIALQKGK